MKAWRLERLGGRLALEDVPRPEPRSGGVLVRVEASTLMSYLQSYVAGRLPFYDPPQKPFTLGTNAIGTIEAVGADVWDLRPGQRVVLSSHFVAGENIAEPAEVLIGLTAGHGGRAMLADWPDGTLADYAHWPAAATTPVEGLEMIEPPQLAVASRFAIPFGGLLRGRLAAGESVVITGATGAYGTAAVLLAVALGAGRVIAAGRNASRLDAVAEAGGRRVATVVLSGDVETDSAAVREAAEGGADLAFDMVGNAADPNATLAALHALRRGGRLVLMGSMTVPLPLPYTAVMLNGWEVLGQFMHPRDAYRRLFDLVRAGLLDLSTIAPWVFPLEALPEAMAAAADAGNRRAVIICP